MEDSKLAISFIVILTLAAGFFSGSMYTMLNYNTTVTETSLITVPITKVLTTTITTTVLAENQNFSAAPILNTVFVYESNFYMVSSSGTIVSIYLPGSYVSYAGEIVNFYSWFNPQYIRYVYSKYTAEGFPPAPSGPDNNYMKFSHIITKYFTYDTERARTIQYNPKTEMPLEVLYSRKGICGDYMHFWALIEIAEGRKVTLVDMFPEDHKVGHAFIIDDEGHVIENNGHVLLDTEAAIILWYNYFRQPLILTYFYADPEKGITKISVSTVNGVPLTIPAATIVMTEIIKGVYSGHPFTATVYENVTGNSAAVTSLITDGTVTYTEYIAAKGGAAVVITTNSFTAITKGFPYNTDFSYVSILPDFLKFKNIVNYEEINGAKIYTLVFSDNDTLIATMYMNRATGTRIIKKDGNVVGVFTYIATGFYS